MTNEALTTGKWLLLGATDDPERVQIHGVRFVFHDEPAGLRGAMVHWGTGYEEPLASVNFDGSTLEIRTKPDEASEEGCKAAYGGIPTLTLRLAGGHFVGGWRKPSGEMLGGPRDTLKLVRYGQAASG